MENSIKILGNFKIGKNIYYKCLCYCGKEFDLYKYNYSKQKSCGCFRKEFGSNVLKKLKIHGDSKTPMYNIFKQIKSRCECNTSNIYKHYGARGIKCEWLKYEDFKKDMGDTYKKGLSIDRIDNNGNYSKDNCRWSTQKEQMRNTRRNVIYKGKCLTEWCEKLNLNRSTMFNRIHRGWDIEKALFTKVRNECIKN